MLLNPDTCVETLHSVVRLDRNRTLGDDRPVIDLLVDKVDRYPGDFDTVLQSFLNRVRAGKGREKRRVNIEDSIGKTADERGRENSHESGKNHSCCSGPRNQVCNGQRETIPVCVGSPPDDGCLDTCVVGTHKCACFGLVGDIDTNMGTDVGRID